MSAEPSPRDPAAPAAPEFEAIGGGLIEWGYIWYQVRRSPLTIVGIMPGHALLGQQFEAAQGGLKGRLPEVSNGPVPHPRKRNCPQR